jgi:hypothetical protein
MKEALHEADQQTSDKTVTQPDWEVGGDDTDVDHTQTAVPGPEDRTQTVVPGDDEDDDAVPDPGGQTVMGPDTAMGAEGATQPAVPDSGAAEQAPDAPDEPAEAQPAAAEEEEADDTNWALVGGGVVAALLVLVGGYVAFTQLGRGGGAAATLSLTSAPEGATVLVNGDTAGTTPINGYSMEAGAVQLQVRKEGYSPVDTTFTTSAGGRVALQNVTLAEAESDDASTSDAALADNTQNATDRPPPQPDAEADGETSDPAPDRTSESSRMNESADPGPAGGDESADTQAAASGAPTGLVEVTPEPSGTVLVDGNDQGGGGTITLTEGDHTVTCRHPRHGSVQKRVTVSAGQTQSLTCYFEQPVVVSTTGAWGRIWRNGRNTGKNTNTTLTLPPGEHRIEVRRESLSDFRVDGGRVKIERGGESNIESFSGQAYRVQIEPSFTKVEHAVVFTVK